MRYRRAHIPGASYFFTVNLARRKTHLLTEHIGLLRQAFREVKAAHPFAIDAIVIMPDHLHAVWTLPDGDSDYSLRWGLIKGGFSRELPAIEPVSKSRVAKGERGIWQRRFWEHVIRDSDDYRRHVDYIHFNPVKHGFVERPGDWKFSSIHRYIRGNVLPVDWACCGDFDSSTFGERE
jgi:putative transposase